MPKRELIFPVQRGRWPVQKIKRNRYQCNICKDIIESKHRHDFVSCNCGRIFVDGGLDYIRCGFTELTDLIDLCEYENEI